MLSRIALLLITVFWLSMNFMLWRSEFGGRNHIGVSVPSAVVWHKILTAPDNCDLSILHHGKSAGRCKWSVNIGQELTGAKDLPDGVPLDGPAPKPAGYRAQFDGGVTLSEGTGRLGFNLDAFFNTDRALQEFNALFKLRPGRENWSFHTKIAEQTLRFTTDDGDQRFDRTYKYAELQDPKFLVDEFQLPAPALVMAGLGFGSSGSKARPPALGLDWHARSDWITLGHTPVRAYRLEAAIIGRYRFVILVNQVGEILRVELPDEWVLVNSQFSEL